MRKLLSATLLSLCAGCAAWAQAPKADVLDIVFNDDGTVVDASPMANPVRVLGAPDVKRSPLYGLNVLCQEEKPWGKESWDNVRVPYNEHLLAAIQDGMTMEVLARPYFEGGSMKSTWVNIFGGYQGGGFGIIILDGAWDFETVVGGSYQDAKFGPVVDGEWVHLTGVWDKEAGEVRLYVNGQIASTVGNAGGDMSLPYGDPFIGIGVDYDPNCASVSANTFQGDIALARIYDKPLDADEVKALYQEAESRKTGQEEHQDGILPQLRTDADGTVLIANTGELEAFGRAVRMGQTGLDARLEDDIDFSASRKPLSNTRSYTGTFDGQGHTVRMNCQTNSQQASLFHFLTDATIRNLHITGNIATSNQFAASVATHTYGKTSLQSVSSDVAITSSIEGDGTHGGLVGVAEKGLAIDHCLFTGSITSQTTTCCAGFVGWAAGGISIANSLQAASMQTLEEGSAVFARNPGQVTLTNCYYTTPFGDTSEAATLADEEQLANGEVCWRLNGSSLASLAWRQTLDTDPAPTLDQSHGVILGVSDPCLCITDGQSLATACTAYARYFQEVADENAETYQPLTDALRQHAQQATACKSLDELVGTDALVQADLLAIRANQEAYAAYAQAAQATLEKLEGLTSEAAQLLRTYLEDEVAPGEQLPNGSFPYISANFTLDTEAIAREIQYMSDQLLLAMSSSTPAGTEVTMLLQNPDFSQGREGWNGTPPNEYTDGSFPPGAQYWGHNDKICHQTVTGLTNGIYELDMNALDMVGDDNYCTYYTAAIFAGDMEMPVMAPMEDALPEDSARENENCHSSDRIVDGTYRIPYSRGGAAIAMCRGGRYLNRVLVNVTDGTLCLGIRMDGSGRKDDWLAFANTRLFYLGTMDEAAQAMDSVMHCALDRAATTIKYEGDAWGRNYTIYPNYADSLRNELRACVQAASSASTGEEKYALLGRFSTLFHEIYQCRKAYTQCATELESFAARIDDYPDLADELQQMCDEAWNGWSEGAYSTDRALSLGQELFDQMDKLNVEVPAADLMDIVFQGDGTASDISAAQNVVEAMGTPKVVESPVLGMNVFCGAANEWGAVAKDNFVVNVSDALRQGLDEGLTMEVLARPHWEGDAVPGRWCTVFGSEEAGGMGMLVYNGQWCFEAHVGGGYRDAYSGTAPVKDEWVHLVGVWDGAEVKLYIDGRFISSASASGSFKWPVGVPRQWYGIACDLAPEDQGSASFPGDIAIARIYGEPLNGSQVAQLYRKLKGSMSDVPEHSDNATAIQSVSQGRRGQGALYDLSGRRVTRPTSRGIYIMDGKKVVK